MHRIDTSTAQVDKFGAGKNGFTGGNPQTGELPTALNADFFDSVQEEIAAVIEAAGLTLTKSNRAQLLASMKMLVGPGRLLNVQTLTATGNYIPTPGTNKAVVEIVGAGAGGAPCAGSNSDTASFSGGGGSGAYCRFLLAIIPSLVACTVGSGGSSGNAGGATSFGTYCTVAGGSTGKNGTTTNQGIVDGGAGGQTVTTSGVTKICSSIGETGLYGLCQTTLGGCGGYGASSILGLGGQGNGNGAGLPAGGYGAGGGGCFLPKGGSTTSQPGGAGSGGVIIVYEYA